MAYDEQLAERVKKLIKTEKKLEQKKMFGGIAFLVNGNMCCGIHGAEVILRVDPEKYAVLLAKPQVREFDMTGKPMKGWLILKNSAAAKPAELKRWVNEALSYALTLKKK
jgi:TfoX/Sxy family transcriptional regulator of competence genes